jgi:two-component system sensor histidine kinase KdpD
VLDFARANTATQIVIGASRRNPAIAALTGPATGMTITRRSGSIDVHVVSHDNIGKGRVLPRLSGGLTTRRRIYRLATGARCSRCSSRCAKFRTDLTLASNMLLFPFTGRYSVKR